MAQTYAISTITFLTLHEESRFTTFDTFLLKYLIKSLGIQIIIEIKMYSSKQHGGTGKPRKGDRTRVSHNPATLNPCPKVQQRYSHGLNNVEYSTEGSERIECLSLSPVL